MPAGAPPPLLVLDRVERFLDEHDLGRGPLRARALGVRGGSNFTFLLERTTGTFVLRRPPRPPLPPSAHDVVREARLQQAVARQGVRAAAVLAVCEDERVLGVPFSVMAHVAGTVLTDELPPELAGHPSGRRAVGLDLVDALAEVHAANVTAPDLAALARPGAYAERQLRRFSQLWPLHATRPLPVLELAERLSRRLPGGDRVTVVHGDYRLGNVLVDPASARVTAIVDWELGTLGDPRADLGYLVATYTEPGGDEDPLGLSPVTATAGFPARDELVARYEERAGREVERLAWFEALALWRAAVFCEAIYARYRRGELGDAPQAAGFEHAVPRLVEAATAALARDAAR